MKKVSDELKSYHLMHGALMECNEYGATLFARSIRHVAAGFVRHSTYVMAAHSASKSLSSTLIERRLRINIAIDANPIAGLFGSVTDDSHFKRRWNAFNKVARLGVKTCIRDDIADSPAFSRELQTSERDDPFRSDLMSLCIGMLLKPQSGSAADSPRRLCDIANSLNLPKTALTDVLEPLYVEPALEIKQLSRLLGCCSRTLQRELRCYDLTFRLMKQAVRLSIAGFRFRNTEETIAATAQAAGFFDSAHLNHAWQLSCDVSPQAYRSLCRA